MSNRVGHSLVLVCLSAGLALDAKWALLRAQTEDEGVDLAFDPGIASSGAPPLIPALSVQLPLLLGINVGWGSQVVVAPKVMDDVTRGGPSFKAGGTLGFAWKANGPFFIYPHASATYRFLNVANSPYALGQTEYEAGFAILFYP
ncbi:MAG: hypothetical protein ACT4TC_18855 [Myxococcaceae bacterium]